MTRPEAAPMESRAVGRLMLFFAIVFAVEGIGQARVGIILQPLTYYLKTEGWSPLEVTAYFGALNFPWIIKPVFGLISDFVPLFGYRRTSYLILASAAAAPIAILVATPLLLREARSSASRRAFRDTLQAIVAALRSRKLWLVAAFLFLYAFAPGFGTPLYYHMTDRLGFSQAYIGVLG